MNEYTLWVNIWRTVGAVISIMTLAIAGCSANQGRLISDMVKSGSDPIKAHCAIVGPSTSSAVMCGFAASTR